MSNEVEAYIYAIYSDGAENLRASLNSWKSGIEYEVGFWSQWFATKGLSWPDDFQQRMQPRPLESYLESLLPDASQGEARLLDVGSGPITKTGTFSQSKNVRITATDPLAFFYRKIIEESGADVPLATQLAFAEDLSSRFDQEYFDLVTCTNALDHSIEPVWGIIEMLIVTKIGGKVFLGHRRNEAEFEHYSGFHQWNFDIADGAFIIWNKSKIYNVNLILGQISTIECSFSGDMVNVCITKRKNFEIDMMRHHRVLRAALLEALVRPHEM